MAYKTREELMKEIEDRNEEIKGLKLELEKCERYKIYETAANEVAAMREAFVNSGFSKAEAFEMVKLMTNNAFALMKRSR